MATLASAVIAGCTAPAETLPPGPEWTLRSEAWYGDFLGSDTTGGYTRLAHPLAIAAPTTLNVTVVLTGDGMLPRDGEVKLTIEGPDDATIVDEEGASPLSVGVPVSAGSHGVWIRWSGHGVPRHDLFRAQATWLEPAP